MRFEIGQEVGAYRITGVAGDGGMGKVFVAEHTVTKRLEAMKVVLGDRSGTPEQAQRFLREIQVQASLSHPNIVAVHNAFWVDDYLVMMMELVEGVSLQSLLERGRIPLPVGINYACQALEALSYAHGHGVVHRDVTPANIIVTPDDTVKLTDFGLARGPGDVRLTQTGIMVGSLYYMSPEQVKGTPSPHARSDIYSLGAVLYEIATGRKPFDSDNAFSLMRAHVEEVPQPPIEVEPGLAPALNQLILTALAKKPEDRFQNASLFRSALENVSLVPPVPAEHKSFRGVQMAIALGIVVFALFVVIFLRLPQDNAVVTVEPPPAATATVPAPPEPKPAVPAKVRAAPRRATQAPSKPQPIPKVEPAPEPPEVQAVPAANATPPELVVEPHIKKKKRRHFLIRALGKVVSPFKPKKQDEQTSEESAP